jgi:hypothetical protein
MKMSLFIVAVLGCGASLAIAAPQCTQQTTRGYWGFTCEGELPAGGASLRSLGTCTASRTAFWDCTATVNLGGQIVSQELHGQAHNNADCTGNITYEQTLGGQPAGQLQINYVIFDQGDAIKGLPTNSGGVLACSLKRIKLSEDH